MLKLDNWSVVCDDNPFAAPEQMVARMRGVITGHPHIEDGKIIHTSTIQEAKGREVRTQNNIYLLGTVDADYRKWLKKHRPKWDWKNPFKKV